MHFSIRYLTEYNYDTPVSDNLNALRVRPATTSSQRCDKFHTRIEPEARVSRHLDYFGTEVLEFGVPTTHESLTIDVRARVVTSDPPEPPRGSWGSVDSDAYIDAAGEFALPWHDRRSGGDAGRARWCQPAGDAGAVVRADPRPLRIPARGHLCRIDCRRPAGNTCRGLPGLRAPLAGTASSFGHRRALRIGLLLGGTGGWRRGFAGGGHARLAGGPAPRNRRTWRADLGGRRPHEPPAGGGDTCEDRTWALLLGRGTG